MHLATISVQVYIKINKNKYCQWLSLCMHWRLDITQLPLLPFPRKNAWLLKVKGREGGRVCMCLSDRTKQKIHLHRAQVSRAPAVCSVTTSLAASFPPDTGCQPRLAFMDGWIATTPRAPEDRGSEELSSAPWSLPHVDVPKHPLSPVNPSLEWNTPPPTTSTTTYSLSPSHTHTHPSPITPLSHQIGGRGGRQDVRPAGHQLRQRNLLNVLLHQKGTVILYPILYADYKSKKRHT